MDEILELIQLSMKTKNTKCEVNASTVKFSYYNGYDLKVLESYHTPITMREFKGFHFIPLSDIVNEAEFLIDK